MHSTHALVNKSTISLQGFNLRYALVLGKTFTIIPPEYGLGPRIRVEGEGEYYRPDVNWVQTGKLIEAYWIDIVGWLEAKLGPEWPTKILSDGGPRVWFCRAVVGFRHGDTVSIPADTVR